MKRRRVELKKIRVQDGIGTQIGPRNLAVVTHMYGGDDKSVFDHEEASNLCKGSKGATKANILCSLVPRLSLFVHNFNT